MKNKISIVGYGEIGKAIHEVYKDFNEYEISIVDKQLPYYDNIKNSYIMNICIPYSDNFIEIVNEYIINNNPYITIIHSTVAPGTTEKIIGKKCHSPVRGLHPNLKDGIKTFIKYIGSDDNKTAKEYQEHLNNLNIKSYICKNSKTSEYAKLLDTSYYGLCIAFHAEVNNLCLNENLDFEEVMTIFNTSYNDGYSALNKNNFIRPVLYPTNKIGGHCIIPNAKIIKQYTDSKIFDIILKYE